MRKNLCLIIALAMLIARPESFFSSLMKAPLAWMARRLTDRWQPHFITRIPYGDVIYDELWEFGHNGPLQRLQAFFAPRTATFTDEILSFLEEGDGLLEH